MPTKRIHLANQLLEKAWKNGWATRPSLDPGELVEKARGGENGLLGPASIWWPNLCLLSASLEDEAKLNPLGRVIAHGQLVSALRSRLRAYALWHRHPDIVSRPLPRPIVILGQMRSGTTRLQRLLSCDPALAVTRFYEGFNPLPSRRRGWTDDRPLRGALGLATARMLNPQFNHIHPTALFEADEEIGLQSFSLFGSAFEAQWRIPTFTKAMEAVDTRPFYREFANLVRTLAWLRRDPLDRPVVLKLPQFGQDIDALLSVFPDARIVRVQRNQADVIASSASMVENQMSIQSDSVDPLWIGREWTRKAALRDARINAALSDPKVSSLVVPYDHMSQDWRGAIGAIYDFFEIALSPQADRRMAATVRRDRRGQFRHHRYDRSRYGLPLAV